MADYWNRTLDDDGDSTTEKTCPRCAGTGTDRKDPDEDCTYCEGYGTLIY